MQYMTLTREERQRRRSRWHGALMIAWGLWVVAFGAVNFKNPSYAAFGLLPYWFWGGAGAALGLAAIILSGRPESMRRAIPGRLALFFWIVVAGCFLIGDYRTTGVPIYSGLAANAYFFLVKE